MDFSVIRKYYYVSMDDILHYIIDKKAVSLLDNFTELFGVRIAFFSKQFQPLAVGKNAPNCAYCRLVRENLGLESACLVCDEKNLRAAAEKKQLVAYHCHGGMLEAIYPVYVYKRLIGYIMMGQCRTSEHVSPRIAALARKKKISCSELEKAYCQIPLIPPAQSKSLLQFFMLLVQNIITNNLVNVNNNLMIDQIMDHLRANLHRQVTLGEAARVAGRSGTTVTHLVKKTSGKSFKQISLELKLDEAERLLTTMPGMTVAEAAYSVGFDDALYFSRIFRKYKNKPPSSCKA